MPVVRTDGWVDGQLYGQVKVTTNNCRNFTDSYICRYSDFVTNSYGVSLDSSCEKPWVPVKKKKGPKWKMLGSLCNETVNLKTDSQTLYYSILKLKYSSSIKAKRNMHHQTTSIRTATEITWTGYCYKNTCSDWLIDRCLGPTRCMLWIILRLLGFSCVREAGRRTHTCRYM